MGDMDRRAFITACAAPALALGMTGHRPEDPIPVLRVAGKSYGEIGAAVGTHFRERIRCGLAARKEWVQKLEDFVAADRSARYDGFLSALRDAYPHLVEEMRGYAEGAGVSFERLFTVAINPELRALMRAAETAKECTTFALVAGDKLWVAHNEDGAAAYRPFMYLFEVDWPSGVSSLSLTYPGYFPGNGPAVNSAGLALGVNFISSTDARPGVPRYALDRAALEARNLDEALAAALHPRRSYSQHHLFLSRAEGKVLSVEVAVGHESVLEVQGLYAHANHFLHQPMAGLPQLAGRPDTSHPRQQAADAWIAAVPDPAALTPDRLFSALQNHALAPLSICRHPGPGITGSTLGSLLALGREGRCWFADYEPCADRRREFDWPRM